MSGQQTALPEPSNNRGRREKWLASDAAGEQLGQLPETAWRRVHPMSPLLQTLGLLSALLISVIYFWGAELVGNTEDAPWEWSGLLVLIVLGAIVAFVAICGGFLWLAWTRMRFAVDENAVYFQSGILAKTQRVARLNRVQAVDIVEPLLARIFGLARVDIEVAGGMDSKIQISYLKKEEARALREEILGRVKAAKAEQNQRLNLSIDGIFTPADPADETEYQLLEVPTGRLVAASFLSPATISVLLTLIIGAAVIGFSFFFGDLIGTIASTAVVFAVLIPFALTAFAVVFSQVNAGFNFRLAVSPDGIRIRRGLTETRSQTIAPTRIQAVQLRQGIIWRMLGWWKVQVNVAGYGGVEEGSSNGGQTLILPVGDRDQALTALWTVLPDLGATDVLGVLDAALEGQGNAAGFITSPKQARWFDPISWRHNGVLLTKTATIIRRHRFSRTVTFIPHARVQSVSLEWGPLDARLGLVDFVSHSVPGPVTSLHAYHLDKDLGAAIMALQSERIVEEKKRESIEEWQHRMGLVVS